MREMARLHTEMGKDTGIFWRVKSCKASRADTVRPYAMQPRKEHQKEQIWLCI